MTAVPQIDQGPLNTRTRTAVFLIAIFLAAVAVRSVDLGHKSLWGDEGATWANATAPIDEILETQDHRHPPGYYAVVHAFIQIDDRSEAVLRLPSVLATALAIPILFVAVRRIWSAEAAIAASLLLLVSPLDFWYAQEARQAGMASLFVAGFAYVFVRRDWIGNALGIVLLPLGLYYDYIVLAGWLGLLGVYLYPWKLRRTKDIGTILGITAVGFAIFLPIQGAEFSSGWASLLTGSGPSVWYGRVFGSNPITSSALGISLTIVAGGTLAALLIHKGLTAKRLAGIMAQLMLLAFSVYLIAPAIDRAYSVKRIIVVASPLIVATIAFVLVEHKNRIRWIWVGAIGAIAAVSLVATYQLPKDDWRSAISHIEAEADLQDVVWVPSVPWLTGVYEFYGGHLPLFMNEDPSAVVSALPKGSDVWLVTRRRPQDPTPAIAAERWFDDNADLGSEYPVHRMSVRQYRDP